ncbi:hypothetical protein RND81_11G183700 [Saponaria officinalis]|uniref:PGG domain-containing protein n=1 Tax=Saponaria officinalis TaxID=3572 RepID=A0AAW1HNZ2_SAPOF
MDKSLYIAAMAGDTGFLREARDREIETGYWDQYLVSKTPQNNNIIHIASLHGHVDFIKTALTLIKISPSKLIYEINGDGDTPLHIASKKGNFEIVQLLVCYSNLGGAVTSLDRHGEIEVAKDGDGEGRLLNSIYNPELSHIMRIQNREGNTPLHEALIYGKINLARYLVELDDHVTGLVNNRKETPLHLAIKHNVKDEKQLVIETIELINKQHASLTYKASKCPTQEESSSMIQLLINKSNVEVLYMHDKDGLTPLLRAAIVSHVPSIKAIVTKSPQTAEICDFNGQTILHLVKMESYDDAKTLIEIPSIICLKDRRDNFGNTPAIVAVKDIIEKTKSQINIEAGLFKALLVSSANLTIKNNMGISAVALIEQHKNMFSNIRKVESNEELKTNFISISWPTIQENEISEIRDAIQNAKLSYLTQKIEMLGNNNLSYYGHSGEGNVLHGVIKAWKNQEVKNYDVGELLTFIMKVLEKFPAFLCQVDSEGNTLLHVIVRELEITKLFLDKITRYFERYQQKLTSDDEEVYYTPWKVKNYVEGNTPFHEALLHTSSFEEIISFLKEYDTSVFALKNHKNETPLHVLCRRISAKIRKYTLIKEREQVTSDILEAYTEAAYLRDADGLTPLLRAAQSGNINEAQTICLICPDSAQLRDNQGRTFWHIIDLSKMSRPNENYSMSGLLLENEEIKQLLFEKDKEGNTPIERAIKVRSFHFLKALKPHRTVFNQVEDVLNEGDIETQFLLIPAINCAQNLPQTMEEIVWKTLEKLPANSVFGVSESEIKDYSQNLGVIGVLLATIAFTAAFTIPGGFRQEHAYLNQNDTSVPFTFSPSGAPDNPNITWDIIGTPVLLGSNLIPTLTRLAYWVFMVSDITSMCLATFAIYCQLWMMKNTQMRMVLIDMSIYAIQVCFFTTMITFMMGVFATTIQVEPPLAYITLLVCSILMLLMNRWLFPIKTIFLWFIVLYEVIIQTLENYLNCKCRISPCTS